MFGAKQQVSPVGGKTTKTQAPINGPEDDWGPVTAAVLFFIILAGLIYGSTNL
jgi:hypothetical protein